MNNAKSMLEFLELIGCLKHSKRVGWVRMDVADPESISGHMYRMAIMTMLMDCCEETKNLNRIHCMQLALVHDMGEAIIGDITPYCGVEKAHKRKIEDEAMQKMQKLAGDASGELLYNLYKEYEEQKTQEAKFVKELDRFDMLLQAFEYEKRDKTKHKLQQFFDNTQGMFKNRFVVTLLDEMNSQRSDFEANDDTPDVQQRLNDTKST